VGWTIVSWPEWWFANRATDMLFVTSSLRACKSCLTDEPFPRNKSPMFVTKSTSRLQGWQSHKHKVEVGSMSSC